MFKLENILFISPIVSFFFLCYLFFKSCFFWFFVIPLFLSYLFVVSTTFPLFLFPLFIAPSLLSLSCYFALVSFIVFSKFPRFCIYFFAFFVVSLSCLCLCSFHHPFLISFFTPLGPSLPTSLVSFFAFFFSPFL